MENDTMKKYQGIIFDLDGTLLNTIADLGHSANLVREEYGYPPLDASEYRNMVGSGMMNLMCMCFPDDTPEEEFPAIFDRMLYHYDRHYMDETAPYPGIPELLGRLAEAGLSLCVNSNKRDEYTKALIAKSFPDVPFVEVLGETDRFPRKPQPDAALYLALKMELPPRRIVYVGDSGVDIDTGSNAGMDTVGCLWGFRGEAELKGHGATHLAADAGEVIAIILGET